MQLDNLDLSKSVEVTEESQEMLYVFVARSPGGGEDSGAVDEG